MEQVGGREKEQGRLAVGLMREAALNHKLPRELPAPAIFFNHCPDLLKKWIRAFVCEDTVYCLSAHTSYSFCFQCSSNLLFVRKSKLLFSLSILPLSTVCKTDRALIKSKRDFQNNNVTLRLTFRWSFSNLNRVKFRLASNLQNISLVIDSVLEEQRLFSWAAWHELLFLLASVPSSQTEKLFFIKDFFL